MEVPGQLGKHVKSYFQNKNRDDEMAWWVAARATQAWQPDLELSTHVVEEESCFSKVVFQPSHDCCGRRMHTPTEYNLEN